MCIHKTSPSPLENSTINYLGRQICASLKKDSDAPLYYLSQNQRRNQENMKHRKVTRIIYPLKLHGVHTVWGGMRRDTEV